MSCMSSGSWTIPTTIRMGAILFIIGLSGSISACTEVPSGDQPPTPPSSPSETPVPLSTPTSTSTPARSFWSEGLQAFEMAVDHVSGSYPDRAMIRDLVWEELRIEPTEFPNTGTIRFSSGNWGGRVFDSDLSQPGNMLEISLKSTATDFHWVGYFNGVELEGRLVSGGLFPTPAGDDRGSGWQEYSNERYGYRFRYPQDARIFERGVSFYEESERPEELSPGEYLYELYHRHGHNLCVELRLDEGYILFDAPINHSARYTFCRRLGPQAGSYEEKQLLVPVDGLNILAEGKNIFQTDPALPEMDEWYVLYLPSGMRIEFGGDAQSWDGIEKYQKVILPELLQILESYQSLP